jgi:hypothetical protein
MSQEPGIGPAPTRPNWKWLVVFVVAIVTIEVVTNWSDVSTFAHIPQIEHTLGIG